MKVDRNVVFAAALVGLVAAAAGVVTWQQHSAAALPEGFVTANGRVEANQIDIATKIAGLKPRFARE